VKEVLNQFDMIKVRSNVSEKKWNIVDATFGAGGHSEAILNKYKFSNIIAADRDPEAFVAGRPILEKYKSRIITINTKFSNLHNSLLYKQKITSVDGFLLDIGVSSMQLNNAKRGFSFRQTGPLDMRMGNDTQLIAAHLVNALPQNKLADLIYIYGEERKSKKIAEAIARERKINPITTTTELADLIKKSVGSNYDSNRLNNIHPATRTFQALRMYINKELYELKSALICAEQLLRPGGILVVISFHSLEDIIVKQFLYQCAKRKSIVTQMTQSLPTFNILSTKPLKPSEEEITNNPRSRR